MKQSSYLWHVLTLSSRRLMNTTLIMISCGVALVCHEASARDTKVKGYIRHDGNYVEPHARTRPNRSSFDNYSTRGNLNPYNGREGTVDPYAAPKPRSRGQR